MTLLFLFCYKNAWGLQKYMLIFIERDVTLIFYYNIIDILKREITSLAVTGSD